LAGAVKEECILAGVEDAFAGLDALIVSRCVELADEARAGPGGELAFEGGIVLAEGRRSTTSLLAK